MKTWRINQLNQLEKHLGIKFKNINLLHTACLHSSYINEHPEETENYEKLELLGDSVLAFLVLKHLYLNFSHYNEGQLSKIKATIVSEPFLATIAKNLNLNNFILLGHGEKKSQGMNKDTILADVLEAILGAYFLDSEINKVDKFISPFITQIINKINNDNHKDYKTHLQLIIQKEKKTCPIYETIKSQGPDHAKTFYVQVLIEDKTIGKGYGNNKKTAQQSAARNALSKLGHLNF